MSPRAVIRGGVLTFAAVDAADEGEYTCKALNTHGEHAARVSLVVQSTSLPRWSRGERCRLEIHRPLRSRVRLRRSGLSAPGPGQPPEHPGPRGGHAEDVLPSDGIPRTQTQLAEKRRPPACAGEPRARVRCVHGAAAAVQPQWNHMTLLK